MANPNPSILAELPKYTRDAVRFYWQTRSQQLEKQRKAGGSDQGSRSAVTGGAQMDGFIELLTKLVIEAGIDRSHIYYKDSLELPGYFRPSKRWDFLVVVKNQLIAALESKSQVGPSFGNNFNNRTEEAMGSALDLWKAFSEQTLAVRPWVGYMLFVEDSVESAEVQRHESFCRRLFLERYCDRAALMVSTPMGGHSGDCLEPTTDFAFQAFANSLFARIAAFSGRIKQLPPCLPVPG